MKYTWKKFLRAGLWGLGLFAATSCVNDLDVKPIDPNLTVAEDVYATEAGAKQALAKLYAGFVLSGQQGPAGRGDLAGFDEGRSQYWRAYWTVQQHPTDETINGWNDDDLPRISQMTWVTGSAEIAFIYYRTIYEVTLANDFIRQVRKFRKADWSNADTYLAEARFVRALAYWHALDLFGNRVPFITEANPVGAFEPKPAGPNEQGPELFNYLVSELKAITGTGGGEKLLAIGEAPVGRANQGAAIMLLAKLYLNHPTYLGGAPNSAYYQEALDLLKTLVPNYSLVKDKQAGDVYNPYQFLFLADNHMAFQEIILAFSLDGVASRTFGSTTYIINAATGGKMDPQTLNGTTGAWGGNRVRPNLVKLFADPNDQRALFFTDGQSLEITNQFLFTEGYAAQKYKNKTRKGLNGSNNGNDDYPDTDVPVFRVADAYLMMAELELRLGAAQVTASTLDLVNQIRTRANATPVTFADVTLPWLLDERSRELYWEAHRRTDLIRFGKFTAGDDPKYLWPFKGGVVEGQGVPSYYVRMPFPPADLGANPNLKQNTGYTQ